MIYTDVNLAAQAALQEAAYCSQNTRECGGVILERDGKFYFTPPHTSNKPFGVDMPAYLAPRAKGERIVADYHVHICSDHNRLFSPYFSKADALLNEGFHTVGYMLSLCDDNVRRYDPAQDDQDDEEVDFKPHADGKRRAPIFLTCGHITGFVPYQLEHMRKEWTK